jgi:hypothetical protein
VQGQDSIIFDPPVNPPRPGEPPTGFPDNPTPGLGGGASSTASSGPSASASGVSLKAARGLKIAKSLKLKTFGSTGMKITIDVPSNTKVLDLRLVRRSNGRLKQVLGGIVSVKKVPKSGHLVLSWKPGRKAVSKLFAGKDIVRVRVGRDRTHLGSTLAAPVRLVGPRITAKASRKH